ncbi:hypothetical protein GGI43DRAFT_433389 [Trichoderma evansii]
MEKDGEVKPSAGSRERKPQDLQNNFRGSISGSEPVLDYIQDLDVRLRMFEELNRQPAKAFGPLNVAVFSVFMVAPITRLEKILHDVQRLTEANDQLIIECVLGNLICRALYGIQAFANKGGYQYRSTQAPPMMAQCLHQVQTHRADIWCSMREQIQILESPQNLICLDPKLHWYFNNREMALKPLRKTDHGSVVVQLHWLKQPNVTPSTSLQGIDMDEWMQRAGLADNSAWGDNISGLSVETGQRFVLSANDPAHVPNFELLQLSWDLLRIMAISGVARLEDLSDYSGSDGDIYHESNSGIWSEDGYAQLRSWAEGIQTDEELENNAESSS